MFTMSLQRVILLFSLFTVTYQAIPVTTKVSDTPSIQPCLHTVKTSEDILELRIFKLIRKIQQQDKAIALQNIKIEEQNKRFEQQDTRCEQQNTRFEQQDTRCEQQNTRFEQQDTRFEQQDTRFEQQNTRFEQQNTRFEQQNTRFEQQDTRCEQQNTKLAEQNTELAEQNTKLSEQKNKMLQQNNKIKEMEMKIEELEKEVDQANQPPSRNAILTNVTVQNTKLSEQILKQNSKIRNLEINIEELEKEVDLANQPPTRNAVLSNVTIQNTKLAEEDIKILAKIKNLELEIEDSRQNQPSPRNNLETGSIFTRWGRRDCPRNVSQLVYSGIAGGSYYNHPGGAAEYVCLPPDPSWNQNKHYNGSGWGFVYGTTYENIPKAIQNYKVPCAVCRTSQLSTVVMIPARSECYPGWQEAYHGELVSGYYDHKAASQYVCLDDDPQTNGTNRNDGGKSMYSVRAKCGSLPCPPYEQYALLTCVVCLK